MATNTKNTGVAEIHSGEPVLPNRKAFRFLGGLVVALLILVALGALARNITSSSDSNRSGRETIARQSTCFGGSFQSFQVNAGDTVQTVPTVDERTGLGCRYGVFASEPLVMLVAGTAITIPKGNSRWRGREPRNLFWVVNPGNGTAPASILFEFIGLAERR